MFVATLIASLAFATPVASVDTLALTPAAVCHPDPMKGRACRHEAAQKSEKVAAAPAACHPDPSKDNACSHNRIKAAAAKSEDVQVAQGEAR